MKKIILPILFCVSILSVNAQVLPAAYLQGRDFYNRLAYSEAIPLLEKECSGKSKFIDAYIMLADCYRQTNQYALAEAQYAVVCNDARLKDDVQKLYYAQILQINNKYEQAAIWYGKYLEKFPQDRRAQNQKAACENVQQFKSLSKYYITNLPFNTNGYDFGACVNGNMLYYTSTGGKVNDLKSKDINLWTGERFMDLYTVGIIENDSASDEFTAAKPAETSVNTKYNEGPLCFNKAKTKVYFTRNHYNPEEKAKMDYSKEKEANLNIYEADIVNGKWVNVKELPFDSKEYSCGHPVLDEENNLLYFSSDMPGSYGGTDLWKSKFANGKWEKPVNLGTTINTEGDEMFPTFDNNKTFYFASDGQGGLGGLDIFSAKISGDEVNEIKNLGNSLNSSYDDFSFLLNENNTSGFFSSDRPGGKGEDDIYKFNAINYELEITVINKFTKAPISNAHIAVKEDVTFIKDLNTNDDGVSKIEVEPGLIYALNADAPSYLPASIDKEIENNEKKPLQKITIELQPMVMQVLVIDAATKKPISGTNITCVSPCNNVPKNNTTDESGTIYYAITDKCVYGITAKAKSYLPKPEVQITASLKDTTFVLIELVQITEKAITLNNIYYDFDKWDIRSEAEVDLKMLLSFMKENPEAKVELSSHTDARADDVYNLILSQKRAQAAVDWLVANGVDKSKIKPVGYGEKKPVNKCKNNIKCSEEEHQRNRRTEFKVLNAGEIINSKMKEKIFVDPCNNCLF